VTVFVSHLAAARSGRAAKEVSTADGAAAVDVVPAAAVRPGQLKVLAAIAAAIAADAADIAGRIASHAAVVVAAAIPSPALCVTSHNIAQKEDEIAESIGFIRSDRQRGLSAIAMQTRERAHLSTDADARCDSDAGSTALQLACDAVPCQAKSADDFLVELLQSISHFPVLTREHVLG